MVSDDLSETGGGRGGRCADVQEAMGGDAARGRDRVRAEELVARRAESGAHGRRDAEFWLCADAGKGRDRGGGRGRGRAGSAAPLARGV